MAARRGDGSGAAVRDPKSVRATYVAARVAELLNYALKNDLAVAMDDDGVWMGIYADTLLLAQVSLDLDEDGDVVWKGKAVGTP